MGNSLLMGVGRLMVPLPETVWQGHVSKGAEGTVAKLAFMSKEHHRVRDFVVKEIPRAGEPLSPETIAGALDLPLVRVVALLDELEKNMTFLFRNEHGAVTWAYPVTVAQTPHQVAFSTGEQGYAAWAIDAIATPFVQGQLRDEPLYIVVSTQCAHCAQPLHLEIDSELNYRVMEDGAEPLVFSPMVDFGKLGDPSIIDAFWRNSVFFWSEEHAKEHRSQQGGMRGTYLTLSQAAHVTRLVQGALFAFPREAPGA